MNLVKRKKSGAGELVQQVKVLSAASPPEFSHLRSKERTDLARLFSDPPPPPMHTCTHTPPFTNTITIRNFTSALGTQFEWKS